MLKWPAVAAIVLCLSGCGAIYISPQVDAENDRVQVVPLTAKTLQRANQDPYEPVQVPDAFFQTAPVSGIVSGPRQTPKPSLAAQARPTVMPISPPPDPATGPYRIGVGDVVILASKTAGSTVQELSGLLAAQSSRQGYTVQDDGAIAVPDVGRIRLAGSTLQEAEGQLFQSLVQKGIEPTFSLEIAEFNSQNVTLGGAVAQPVIIPIDLTPLFLDEALARAGGFSSDDPESTSLRIYRAGTLFQIPLTEYLARPVYQKTRLIAGDSIFVDSAFTLEKAQAYFQEQITLAQLDQQGRAQALAELTAEIARQHAALAERRATFQDLVALDAVARDHVYLSGEVARPGRFALPFGRAATVADALFSGNGFSSETGNPSQIYVLRGVSGSDLVTAWRIDTSNAANLVLATRMELRPNDIIFIAEQPVTRWNRALQQIVPSLITSGAALASQ
ncbi:polysaccharide biosynthesis/export family protein [Yoonia sp.]|uniref:polysaccharide biosynthesis/export family protein n=1 Tax=Yoonia sp. TaxID=2212373 RepID=UPI003F6C12B0